MTYEPMSPLIWFLMLVLWFIVEVLLGISTAYFALFAWLGAFSSIENVFKRKARNKT